MQKILFLKSPESGEVNRLINIDLLAMAEPDPENPQWTRCGCGVFTVTIHTPFSEFIKQVEHLIAENYRISLTHSMAWDEKRKTDTRETLEKILSRFHPEH